MFTWYWVFLFWIILYVHTRHVVHTVYVHRGISHGLFKFSNRLSHVFRFILWLTGFTWPNWMQHYAAQHRKHHKYSDTELDPHSPNQLTFTQMLDYKHNEPGRPYYISPDEVKFYAPEVATPADWMQKNIYDKHQTKGKWIILLIVLILFGFWGGLTILILDYLTVRYIYIWSANYLLHGIGYTHIRDGQDRSVNVVPWGILFGGEELHNNHHSNASLPYFHSRWWEYDIGWTYAKLFMFFGLMSMNQDKIIKN